MNATETSAARALRIEVDRVGGRLTIATSTLLAIFGADELTATSRQQIAGALSADGLTATPQVARLQAGERVTLTSATTQRVPAPRAGRPDGEPTETLS